MYRVSGLGVEPPERVDPWYAQLLSKIADPLSGALATRVAHGKTEPGSQFYPAAPAPPAQASLVGGISPTMLLLGGAALLAVMMLGRK